MKLTPQDEALVRAVLFNKFARLGKIVSNWEKKFNIEHRAAIDLVIDIDTAYHELLDELAIPHDSRSVQKDSIEADILTAVSR